MKKYFVILIMILAVLLTACTSESRTGGKVTLENNEVLSAPENGTDLSLTENEPESAKIYSARVLGEIDTRGYSETSVGENYMSFISSLRADDFNGFGLSYIDDMRGFTFAGEPEMNQKLQDAMDALGIGQCNFYYYPVTEEKFRTYGQFYDENINGQTKGEFEENPFGEYKEFYFVQAYQVVDGIELSRQKLMSYSSMLKYGETTIEAIYTSDGIEALRIGRAYRIEGEIETVNLITSEEAGNKLDEMQANLLGTDKTDYTSVQLSYVPARADSLEEYAYENEKTETTGELSDGFELIPAWCFTSDDGQSVYLDAVTGQILELE